MPEYVSTFPSIILIISPLVELMKKYVGTLVIFHLNTNDLNTNANLLTCFRPLHYVPKKSQLWLCIYGETTRLNADVFSRYV